MTTFAPRNSIGSATPEIIGGLQRQADCSLTYLDFSYATGEATASVRPNSQTLHFEKTLHNNALLETTPDLFLAGCVDASRGTTSRPFLFLGTDKNGRELVAAPGASGVVTSGLKSDGTFTPRPSYPTIPNYGFLLATDLDGDGNIDLWTGYGGNGMYGGDAYLPNLAYALMGRGDGTFQGVLVGDPDYAAGTTSLVKKRTSDAAQDLALSAPSPGKLSVAAGQTSVPFNVVVSSPSGTSETVTLACSGLPVLATCMFQPGTVNLTPNQSSVPVSVTIGTTANTVIFPARRLRPPTEWANL